MAERSRPILLRFFVTEEEKEFIKHKMSLMNITNMSAYLRKMAIDGHLIQVDYSQFDNISEQLTGVARNINQIAKRINATDTVYAGDMKEIKQNTISLTMTNSRIKPKLQERATTALVVVLRK